MPSRPELIIVRDASIRYLHGRAPLNEVQQSVLQTGRSMQADGLTMEEILTVLKGAVRLATDHVNQPATAERAAWLRGRLTPWLVGLYLGDMADPEENLDD